MTDIAQLARSLSKADYAALISAQPADCGEYWALEPIADTRLAGKDLVLTPIGIALRAHLLSEQKP